MASFSLDMSAFAKKAGANADKVIRKTFFDISTAIAIGTPKKTGRAQGAWQMSIDSPTETTPINIRSIDEVKAEISAGLVQWKAGQTLWYCNNLSYIVPLEYGHSQQAANGMVRLNIMNLQTFVNNATRSLK